MEKEKENNQTDATQNSMNEIKMSLRVCMTDCIMQKDEFRA